MRVTDPVGVTDIADRCGVTPPAVSNWRERYTSFPAPLFTVGRGRVPVWEWSVVLDWITAPAAPAERPPRPRRRDFAAGRR